MIITNVRDEDSIDYLIAMNQARIEIEKVNLKDRNHNLDPNNTIRSMRKIQECEKIIGKLKVCKERIEKAWTT